MTRKIVIILILLGIVSGIYVFQTRINIENRNNKVGLILDTDEYKLFSYEHGYNFYELYSILHKAGANIAAISEETLEKLKLDGKLTYMSGADFVYTRFFDQEKMSVKPGSTYIITHDKALILKLKREFSLKIGKDKVSQIGDSLLLVDVSPDTLSEFPLYYPDDLSKKLREMGFKISLRVTNFPNITDKSIEEIFKRIEDIKPINIIFAGEEVLGYPDYKLIKKVGEYIERKKIPYGIIEFTNQRGMKFLSKKLPAFALRVHSISKDELEDLSYKKAVDRWVRAVKERNMRLLFVKPIPFGKDMLKQNTSYINDIVHGIGRIGYKVGIPSPLPFVPLNPYVILLLSSIVFFVLYYVLKALLLIPGEEWIEKFVWIIMVLWGLFFLVLLVKNISLSAKFSALTAAIVFPVFSIIINERYFKDKYREDLRGALVSTVSGLLEVSLVSFIGALLVALLLSSTPFMLSIDKFMGVKIAYLLPVLLSMAYLWKRKNANRYPIITSLNKPLRVGDIVILGVLGIVGLLFILRSGNFSFVSIPGFEEKMRDFLEHTLIARPRTKEFFIGHPILMLSIFWSFLRIRTYKIAFIGLGVIGQTTLINSFCHIHTPLKIALLRTFNGLWLGAVMGFIYIAIFYIGYRLYKKYRKIIY